MGPVPRSAFLESTTQAFYREIEFFLSMLTNLAEKGTDKKLIIVKTGSTYVELWTYGILLMLAVMWQLAHS